MARESSEYVDRIESRDVSDHAASLSPWRVKLWQLSGGAFHGLIERIQTENIVLCRDTSNCAVSLSGKSPADYVAFGTTLPRSPQMHVCGIRLDTTKLMVLDQGTEITAFVLAGAHRWILLVRPGLWANATERKQIDHRMCLTGPTREVLPSALAAVSNLVTAVFGTYMARCAELRNVATRRSVETLLVDYLIDEMFILKPEILGFSHDRSKRIRGYRRAIEMIHASPHTPSIPELARYSGVSQRTLEYSFQETLDMTPVQYLRAYRLNLVRQELQVSNPAEHTVASVALRLQFTELGRFAVEYRRLFGESPSKTLRMDPPRSLRSQIGRAT